MNSRDAYIGIGLATLGSNACLLLLVLNCLGWINVLHMDVAAIEQFAETTLTEWKVHFQTATMAWAVCFVFLECVSGSKQHSDDGNKKKEVKNGRPWHVTLIILASVLATLALPQLLQPYRQVHPIIRRSLVGSGGAVTTTVATVESAGVSVSDTISEKNAPMVQQEIVFEVEKMTCGGCGSHVRDLVESRLNVQQKKDASAFIVDKVQVDWKAGIMSIYGAGVTDGVDREDVSGVLGEEYPTKFLYSQ